MSGFEAETSRKSLAGQQGHRPTATPPKMKKKKNVHTQREDGALQTSPLRSSAASHPGQYVPGSSLSFPARTWDDPKAFLWLYEGLAVACGQPEEEAGIGQSSSNCSPGAILQYWEGEKKISSTLSILSSVPSLVWVCTVRFLALVKLVTPAPLDLNVTYSS